MVARAKQPHGLGGMMRSRVSKTVSKARRQYFGSMPWIQLLETNKQCEGYVLRTGIYNCKNPGQYYYEALPRSEAESSIVCWAHLATNLDAEGERERVKQWMEQNPPPELLRTAKSYCG